jgi:hypothetical protein
MSCRQRGRGRTLGVIELIRREMIFCLLYCNHLMGDSYEQVGLYSSADEEFDILHLLHAIAFSVDARRTCEFVRSVLTFFFKSTTGSIL